MTESKAPHPIERLSAWLDGELADDERAGLEAHLAECALCAAVLDDFRRLASTSVAEEPPPVPGGLTARIRLAIATARPAAAPPSRSRFHPLRLAAAAVAVVLAVGLWSIRTMRPARERPPEGESSSSVVAENDRRQGEIEPSAPSPPPPEGDVADSLRSLGYAGGESGVPAAPPPAAGGAKPRAVKPQGRRAPNVPTPDEEVFRQSARTDQKTVADRGAPSESSLSAQSAAPVHGFESALKDAVAEKKEEAGRTAGPMARRAAVPAVRELRFDYPAYGVTVSEAGAVTLTAGTYSCSVRRDGTPVDPDIEALFALASAPRGPTTAPETAGGAPAVVRLRPQAGASAADRGAPVSEESARALDSRLRTLLSSRYLELMERRCGPVPREARSAP